MGNIPPIFFFFIRKTKIESKFKIFRSFCETLQDVDLSSYYRKILNIQIKDDDHEFLIENSYMIPQLEYYHPSMFIISWNQKDKNICYPIDDKFNQEIKPIEEDLIMNIQDYDDTEILLLLGKKISDDSLIDIISKHS